MMTQRAQPLRLSGAASDVVVYGLSHATVKPFVSAPPFVSVSQVATASGALECIAPVPASTICETGTNGEKLHQWTTANDVAGDGGVLIPVTSGVTQSV